MSKTMIEKVLEDNGLSECIPALVHRGGLTDIADLKGVTDQELNDLGVTKIFHRKKIMRLAEGGSITETFLLVNENGTTTTLPSMTPVRGVVRVDPNGPSTAVAVPKPGQNRAPDETRIQGGDHIKIEVLGARGCGKNLTERDYYIKASLCDIVDHAFFPVAGSSRKTGYARGPQPVWCVEDAAAVAKNSSAPSQSTLKITTTFRSHCLALELKEYRLIGDNKLVGLAVFPTTYFHKFTQDTVQDTWFPFRADCERDSEVVADVRLRISVPGGCPKNNQAAFHVKGVVMNERKLRVTVFDATILDKDKEYASEPPNTYITVNLEGLDSRPNNSTTEKCTTTSSLQTKSRSAVVQGTLRPSFGEAFEYFAEASRTKLITVKLKKESGLLITSHDLIAQVRIPIQFYLAQKNPAEVDEVFTAYDENGMEKGQIHIRLEVLARDVVLDKSLSTASLKRGSGGDEDGGGSSSSATAGQQPKKPPVSSASLDNHPVLSPSRTRGGAGTGGRPNNYDGRSVSMPSLSSATTSEDEGEDDDAAGLGRLRRDKKDEDEYAKASARVLQRRTSNTSSSSDY